jgi:hypothetical protein
MCHRPEYLTALCPLYPIKLIKTVRLRVAKVEKLLRDAAMNLKVVVLVRDPRGVYNSRAGKQVSTWCKFDKCTDPEVGCRDLLADILAAEDLAARYPGSVTLVRYEDLSLTPYKTSKGLLRFLDLPWVPAITNYIDTHTLAWNMVRSPVKAIHGTVKNSTATAFAWRGKLGLKRTLQIQSSCREPMARLGYRELHTEAELGAHDLPLDKTAEEVWSSGTGLLSLLG